MATAKRGKGADIQHKNSEKKVVGRPFEKNQDDKKDPRINRHGRPKTHDQLRALIQRIAGEAVDSKPEWSQIELMLRAMMKSKQAQDRKEILEHGWGKPKDEIEHSGEVTLRVVYESDGDAEKATSAAAPVHSKPSQAEGHSGGAPQR